MKFEAYLFAGVAAFFLVTDAIYYPTSRDPAGTAALTVSFLMSSLVSFFMTVQYRRKGTRPEDSKAGEIHQRSGPVDFFPPHSGYPVVVALAFAVLAVGLVYGWWLFLIGLGLMLAGILGMVFQFAGRDD